MISEYFIPETICCVPDATETSIVAYNELDMPLICCTAHSAAAMTAGSEIFTGVPLPSMAPAPGLLGAGVVDVDPLVEEDCTRENEDSVQELSQA